MHLQQEQLTYNEPQQLQQLQQQLLQSRQSQLCNQPQSLPGSVNQAEGGKSGDCSSEECGEPGVHNTVQQPPFTTAVSTAAAATIMAQALAKQQQHQTLQTAPATVGCARLQ